MNKIFSFILLTSILGTGLSSTFNYSDDINVANKQNLALNSYKAINFNGTYNVPLTLDLKMGQEAFDHTAIVEKMDDNYYMTFTQLDSSNLKDMTLISEGLVGTMIKTEGKKKSYTYTVSKEDLRNPFNFSVIVTAMDKFVTFKMDLNLNDATYLGDTIEDRGERPARYIPEIITNASEMELERGSIYVLPPVSATLNLEEIEVKTSVKYLKGEDKVDVEVKDNKFRLAELGTYEVNYFASSSLYKTSLGNDTSSSYSYLIHSKVGASTLAKIEDNNNVLEKGSQLQTIRLISGDTFDLIKDRMKTIADHYEVFSLTLYDKDGNETSLKGEVNFYLRVDDYFNRNKVKIAYVDNDGNFINKNVSNYGRYMKFTSDELGTYVAYVEGVEVKLTPMMITIISICSILGAIIILLAIIKISKIIKENKENKRILKLVK